MQQNKNILQNATTGQPITSIAESLAANLDFIKINVVLKGGYNAVSCIQSCLHW